MLLSLRTFLGCFKLDLRVRTIKQKMLVNQFDCNTLKSQKVFMQLLRQTLKFNKLLNLPSTHRHGLHHLLHPQKKNWPALRPLSIINIILLGREWRGEVLKFGGLEVEQRGC